MRVGVPVGVIEESKIAQKEIFNRIPKVKKKDPSANALADIKTAYDNVVRNGG